MDICTLKSALEVLTPVLALGAAVAWAATAWIGRGTFGQGPMGRETLRSRLDSVLTSQARYHALAATCAFLAAVMQLVVTYFMPVCRALHSHAYRVPASLKAAATRSRSLRSLLP